MKIADWLTQHGVTQAALARGVNLSEGSVSRIVAGSQRPSFDAMGRIDSFTGGAVSYHDWAHADGGEVT